jgi:arylsulfatase A-like enzyme
MLLHYSEPHDPYDFHKGFSFGPEQSDFRKLEDFFPPRRDGSGKLCTEREGIVRLSQESLSEMKANYDGEIAFTDHHVGRLLEHLRDSGLQEKTIIIITSDHGEEFLDHGGYWHGCTLFNELIKVPLIMYLPRLTHREITQKVSTVDLFPTLVELFQKDYPTGHDFSGQSLVSLLEGGAWEEKPVFSATAFRSPLKYSLITGDHKIIKDATGKVIGVYSLADDPGELNNLAARDPELLGRLDDSLSKMKLMTDTEVTVSEQDEHSPDEETLKRLKSLGYVN